MSITSLNRYIINMLSSRPNEIMDTADHIYDARRKACYILKLSGRTATMCIRDTKWPDGKNARLVETIQYRNDCYMMQKKDATVWDTKTKYRISPTTGKILKG